MIDFSTCENDTQKKRKIREVISEVIAGALTEEFGAENVVRLDRKISVEPDPKTSIDFAPLTVIVNSGEMLDKDGCPVDSVTVIYPTVKDWNTVENKNKRVTYGVTFGDILDALEEGS